MENKDVKKWLVVSGLLSLGITGGLMVYFYFGPTLAVDQSTLEAAPPAALVPEKTKLEASDFPQSFGAYQQVSIKPERSCENERYCFDGFLLSYQGPKQLVDITIRTLQHPFEPNDLPSLEERVKVQYSFGGVESAWGSMGGTGYTWSTLGGVEISITASDFMDGGEAENGVGRNLIPVLDAPPFTREHPIVQFFLKNHPPRNRAQEETAQIPQKIGNFVRVDEYSRVEFACSSIVASNEQPEKLCARDITLSYSPEGNTNFMVQVFLRSFLSEDNTAYIEQWQRYTREENSPLLIQRLISKGTIPQGPLATYGIDEVRIQAVEVRTTSEGSIRPTKPELYPTNPVLVYFKKNLFGE